MYVSRYNKVLTSESEQFKDFIDTNMSIDVNDIPFNTSIGINTNFNKNDYIETINYITQMVSNIISNSKYSSYASINGVNYNSASNVFIISLNYKNNAISMTVGGLQ